MAPDPDGASPNRTRRIDRQTASCALAAASSCRSVRPAIQARPRPASPSYPLAEKMKTVSGPDVAAGAMCSGVVLRESGRHGGARGVVPRGRYVQFDTGLNAISEMTGGILHRRVPPMPADIETRRECPPDGSAVMTALVARGVRVSSRGIRNSDRRARRRSSV